MQEVCTQLSQKWDIRKWKSSRSLLWRRHIYHAERLLLQPPNPSFWAVGNYELCTNSFLFSRNSTKSTILSSAVKEYPSRKNALPQRKLRSCDDRVFSVLKSYWTQNILVRKYSVLICDDFPDYLDDMGGACLATPGVNPAMTYQQVWKLQRSWYLFRTVLQCQNLDLVIASLASCGRLMNATTSGAEAQTGLQMQKGRAAGWAAARRAVSVAAEL